MNRADARRILAAWRPDSATSTEPEIGRALEFARQDPELGIWLEGHARFQTAAADALKRIPVPAALAERILAARKTRRPAFRPDPPVALWYGLAAAAGLLLLAVFSGLFQRPPSRAEFATFRSRAVGMIQREYRMDVVTNQLAVIRGYMAAHQAPSDFDLTPGLASEPAVGGGLLSWQGSAVSMICLGGGPKGMLYLFVLPTNHAGNGAPVGPEMVQIGRLPTIAWSARGRTYLLTADRLSMDALKAYL